MKKTVSGFIALRLLITLTVLCGGLYPLLITGLAHVFFPQQAGGSLLTQNGRIVGSRLLAQNSADAGYFHPRPSACAYHTLPGFASNFAVSSSAFRDSIAVRQNRLQKENKLSADDVVPVDMLCASASGLDPHISPAAARMQIARIAAARHLNAKTRKRLEEMVEQMTESRQLGFLGEPRVNVLALNFFLDNTNEFSNFYPKVR